MPHHRASAFADTPVLAGMIVELGEARDEAEQRGDDLHARLADVEALHEPDSGGDCPTCGTSAPCLTTLLLRREISLDQAYAAVRDQQPIDLRQLEGQPGPPVPSLSDLLAAPTGSLDRFFDALLRQPDGARNDQPA